MGTVSRAKRASNNRWDRDNMTNVVTKIRKEEAENFRLACEKQGTTRSAVLHQCIRDYIREYGGKD